MPLFDYKCHDTKCVMYAHPQELLVSNRNDVVDCIKCNKPMEIIMTKGSYFHLKGSWPGKDLSKERGK